MKLIESLIAGEIAPLSPTQFPGQVKSAILSGKGQEANGADVKDAAKGQKNPKDSSEPKDPSGQQGGGLLAMMAAVPSARTTPTLTLNFRRSAGEDSFVKSSKPAEHNDTFYAPEAALVKPQVIAKSQVAAAIQPPMPQQRQPQPAALPAPAAESSAICAIPNQPNLESTPIPLERPSYSRNQFPIRVQDSVENRPRNRGSDQARDHAAVSTPDLVAVAISTSSQDGATTAVSAPASPPPSNAPSTLPPPVAIPAAVPLAIGVPMPVSKGTPVNDRPPAPDRPRPKLESSAGSGEAPSLPPTLGKVRSEASASTEPIAFAARLTEREEPEDSQTTKPPTFERGLKQPSLTQPSQPEVRGKADAENAQTNPKPNPQSMTSQPSSEPSTPKAKPVVAEHALENVPTNPKSPAAFSVPARESAAQAPQASAKSASAAEVKASSPTQETELQAKPTIRSEPAREISIRIPSGDNGNVDVQIIERDGKVQVTVRGSDTQLNSALRGDLTELVHTLDQRGYKTETWTPGDTNPMTSASAPEVKTPGRSEASQDWSGNQPNDGGNGGNSGGNQQQRRQQQERPDWLIELERRLDTEG